MNRRLLLLNLLLIVLLIGGAIQIRRNWLASEARRMALLRQSMPLTPAPGVNVPASPPPVTGGQYIEVASRMLLAKDRNPNVVVEVAAPKVPPPYPRFYGVMDFGSGPSVILAEKAGGQQKSYRLGDQVGEFKLLTINRQFAEFEWEGKTLVAKLSEMRDSQPLVEKAPAPAAAPAAPASQAISILGGDVQKPGAELTPQMKACQSGDTSPAGSVVDGYRKVVSQTPFGNSCRWEKVN